MASVRVRRAVRAAVLGIALLGAPAAAAEDLLVLEVGLGRLSLSDGMVGYLRDGGVLLPLGELAEALEFPISVDPRAGTAGGWFLAEDRRFALDVGRREVLVEGRPAPFDAAGVEARPEDLYVDHRLLGRWFPLDLVLDLARLRVRVEPRETLPVEARLERRRRRQRLERRPAGEESRFPRERLPFRLVDWPIIDTRIDFRYERRREQPARRTTLYNALVTGDFLAMNAELVLHLEDGAGDDFGATRDRDLRLRLERQDPSGGLLGPLRATRFAIGDLYLPDRPLISAESEGRGVEISSFPTDRAFEFDRTSLQGHALPGWEVELYRNGELLDARTVAADGRYEFGDVALLYGFNLFRLVFYGPYGERREKTERFLIGPELLRRGDSYYRLAAYREARDPQGGGPLDPGTEVEPSASNRFLAEVELGLRAGLSLRGGLSSLVLDDGRHSYLEFGLRASGRGLAGALDLVADDRGGTAVRLAAHGRVRGLDLRLRHDRADGFASGELAPSGDPLSSRSVLRLEGHLGAGELPLVVRGSARRETRRSGASTLDLGVSLAARWGRVALAQSLRYAASDHGRRADGVLRFSRSAPRFSVRGHLRYEVSPRLAVEDLSLTGDWQLDRRKSLRLRFQRSFGGAPEHAVEAGLSWRFHHLTLGASGLFAGDRTTWALSLSTSLGRDPLSGRWRARSEPLASQGAVAARVFLDRDRDGRFDPSADAPLEGVRLGAGGAGGRGRTDARGNAFVTGLPVHEPFDLSLALGSLEDPYWVPARRGAGVVARPGRVVAVDFPVVESAEVDGTVYLRRGEDRRAVSSVELELLAPGGEVIAATRSTFDGFYLFEKVPPGSYRLRVAPAQVERLKLVPPPERPLDLEGGEVLSGLDLVLEIEDAPPASASLP